MKSLCWYSLKEFSRKKNSEIDTAFNLWRFISFRVLVLRRIVVASGTIYFSCAPGQCNTANVTFPCVALAKPNTSPHCRDACLTYLNITVIIYSYLFITYVIISILFLSSLISLTFASHIMLMVRHWASCRLYFLHFLFFCLSPCLCNFL